VDPLFYQSLIEGDFGNGFPLRMSLLEGDFWVRGRGAFTIYRGQGHIGAIDFNTIAAISSTEGDLPLPGHLEHSPGSETFYAVRRISKTGKEEKGTQAVVRLTLDEEGRRRSPRPNRVRGLTAGGEGEGRIRLGWFYWPLGNEVFPEYFALYGDQGTGVIDYDNPLAEIPYRNNYFYSFLSEPVEGGKRYRFVVWAVSAEGINDGNKGCIEVGVKDVGTFELEGLTVGLTF